MFSYLFHNCPLQINIRINVNIPKIILYNLLHINLLKLLDSTQKKTERQLDNFLKVK
jgi:hypothetical protein